MYLGIFHVDKHQILILNIVWPSTISNNNWPFSQLLYCIYLLVCIVVGNENNLNKKEWLSEPAVKCSKNSCIINEWLIYTHFFSVSSVLYSMCSSVKYCIYFFRLLFLLIRFSDIGHLSLSLLYIYLFINVTAHK